MFDPHTKKIIYIHTVITIFNIEEPYSTALERSVIDYLVWEQGEGRFEGGIKLVLLNPILYVCSKTIQLH